MPHFLALAWMYRADYERGGFAMLPVIDPSGDKTAYQTLLFTVLLIALSTLLSVFNLTGWIYTTGVLLLGIYFLVPTIRFLKSRTNQAAKQILKASIVYVPAFVGLLILDRFIL
jgi:protoheme IX farnesyltransferase